MFKLPKHIDDKFLAAQRGHEAKAQVFASLNNEDLVCSAKFWMAHCNAPGQFAKDEPIYDATFWHVILPELLKRLERQSL